MPGGCPPVELRPFASNPPAQHAASWLGFANITKIPRAVRTLTDPCLEWPDRIASATDVQIQSLLKDAHEWPLVIEHLRHFYIESEEGVYAICNALEQRVALLAETNACKNRLEEIFFIRESCLRSPIMDSLTTIDRGWRWRASFFSTDELLEDTKRRAGLCASLLTFGEEQSVREALRCTSVLLQAGTKYREIFIVTLDLLNQLECKPENLAVVELFERDLIGSGEEGIFERLCILYEKHGAQDRADAIRRERLVDIVSRLLV